MNDITQNVLPCSSWMMKKIFFPAVYILLKTWRNYKASCRSCMNKQYKKSSSHMLTHTIHNHKYGVLFSKLYILDMLIFRHCDMLDEPISILWMYTLKLYTYKAYKDSDFFHTMLVKITMSPMIPLFWWLYKHYSKTCYNINTLCKCTFKW